MTVIQEVKALRSDTLAALARIEAKIGAMLDAQTRQQAQIDRISSDVQAIKAAVTSQPATGLKIVLGNAEQQ